MRFPSNGADRLNSFALVTYIPDPLGRFLDDLRLEIAPRCNPHAHVSVLPPRPIFGTAEAAWEHIRSRVEEVPSFALETTEIEVFPITNVIYIALGAGRRQLEELHGRLNSGVLGFTEPFVYHPHITLAQEIPAGEVGAALELARRRWREWPHARDFMIDNVTFVQNSTDCGWLDLARGALAGAPTLR